MKDETLTKVINSMITMLEELDIPATDKIELMINIRNFLAPKEYRENIKTLNKRRKKF